MTSRIELLLPDRINTGPWVGGYARPVLVDRIARTHAVLPICSLGTPRDELAALGSLVLPPLYHEALDPGLEAELVAQIGRCFPYFEGTRGRAEHPDKLKIVRLPSRRHSPPARAPAVLAFGADTTVEQHGPHLPLATDTIQTYGVLKQMAEEMDGVVLGPPLEHGHLTWGLPFGFSVDLTPPLLARYVRGFLRAVIAWCQPRAVYLADVHGSLVHRQTLELALREAAGRPARFRWLHEPLFEFAGQRGDVHAGGVETVLVARLAPQLVDPARWPADEATLVGGQMTAADAIALSGNLRQFIARVESQPLNGIVGDVRHAATLDPAHLLDRMLEVAREDLRALR